jgi:uncharacterized protein YkwD
MSQFVILLTALYHYIIPTAKNNYRAKLLSTPFLVVMAIAVFAFNTVVGIVPASKVYASISSPSLLTLHNAERNKEGLSELKINAALTNSAQSKAEAMLDSDCWSHYCPHGESPWNFFTAAGYEYLHAGENLAEGFYDNEDVMVAWMNSPTHQRNILKPEYTEIGFGVVSGRFQGKDNNIVIVVHFGTPQTSFTTSAFDPELSLTTPEITSPQSGDVFNTRDVTITGNAPGATAVELTDNGESWVTADPSEGIFTYQATGLTEQTHEVTAMSTNGNMSSEPSVPVSFTVDLTPDSIAVNQFLVVRITEADNLEVHVNASGLSELSIQAGDTRISFVKSNGSLWTQEVPRSVLIENAELTVYTTDLGGNAWVGSLDSSTVLGQTANLPVDTGRVISANTKSQVNIAFLIMMTVLFLLDFLILSYSGITRKTFKSHFHFAVFIVIGIVIISGIVNGHVNNGVLT